MMLKSLNHKRVTHIQQFSLQAKPCLWSSLLAWGCPSWQLESSAWRWLPSWQVADRSLLVLMIRTSSSFSPIFLSCYCDRRNSSFLGSPLLFTDAPEDRFYIGYAVLGEEKLLGCALEIEIAEHLQNLLLLCHLVVVLLRLLHDHCIDECLLI